MIQIPIRRGAPAAAPLVLILVAGACATGAPPAAPPASGPSDPEIVAIATTANRGEVETSQPVSTRATSGAVREFAQRMVADHGAANQRLEALGIAPQQSQVSQQLTQSARRTTQVLAQYAGPALDHAYIDSQVDLHQYTLDVLDEYLVPSARDVGLQLFLQEMRATVAMHLEEARRIQGE